MTERSEVEIEYEKKRREVGRKYSVYVIDRILTRSILITVIVFILAIFVMFTGEWIVGKIAVVRNELKKNEIEARLKEYYAKEEYEQMDNYMSKMKLDSKEYYGYTQATILDYYYNEYLNHKYSFLSMSSDEQWEDDYHLRYAISNSLMVYQLDCGIYDEPDPLNFELYEKYQKEILSFWIATLKLTNEEVESLMEEGKYFKSGELETLVDNVKKRCINVE